MEKALERSFVGTHYLNDEMSYEEQLKLPLSELCDKIKM